MFFALAITVLAAVCEGKYPLLPITNATSAWALPNPTLPYPVGPNPGLAYELPSRLGRLQLPTPYAHGLRLGDVRARLHVSTAAANAQSVITAQIFWRRRDHNVSLKAVVVTDDNGSQVRSSVSVLERECGVITFAHTGQ